MTVPDRMVQKVYDTQITGPELVAEAQQKNDQFFFDLQKLRGQKEGRQPSAEGIEVASRSAARLQGRPQDVIQAWT